MVKITEITPGSFAERAGIRVGDLLVSVNGREVRDVLDYRFYLAEESVSLSLRRGEETLSAEIQKDLYGDIGLGFETPLMDEKLSCRNKCIFCFIDQLPRECARASISRMTIRAFPSCTEITSR